MCPECLVFAPVGHLCANCAYGYSKDRSKKVRIQAQRDQLIPKELHRPIATFVLLALNVLGFIVTAIDAHDWIDNTTSQLFRDMALRGVTVAYGDWWQIITAGFMHIGPIHLAVNMFALYVLGRDAEGILGTSRFLIIYCLSLLGASATVVMFENPLAATAGASGALFGLFGAELFMLLRVHGPMRSLLIVLVINALITVLVPGISYWGHIGGFVTGSLVSAALLYGPDLFHRQKTSPGIIRSVIQPPTRNQVLLSWLLVAMVAVIILFMLVTSILRLRAEYGF